MLWISLTAGRRLGRLVLYGIALYFTLLAPKAARASRAYLTRVLGRPPRWAERYRHVLCFASTIHDRVFLLKGRGAQFNVEVQGADELHAALADGQGALLMGAHLGSFEVLRTMGRERGNLRVAMAMYPDNARKLNATLAALAPELQQDVIALGHVDAMLAVRDRLEQGNLVGLLADRSLGAQDACTRLPLLGDAAPFPDGPWRLAVLLQRPVFFMAGLYLGSNRYQIRFERIADFRAVARSERSAAMAAAQQAYVQAIARALRDSPWNWFNFYDFWQTPE
ncbi:MAG: acyl-CoA synthetase [Proteobacteria bacterium]|nr:acyl-CoA synthetase [Pseudomonadota bacterium]MBS0494019.1 acyl-CoA synthetase [Pseudomonadota bacterium]